jgi:acyl carrier protein
MNPVPNPSDSERDKLLTVVRESLGAAVPGADPGVLAPDDVIRQVLEIDSLDFLSFVETLSERTAVPIDEDDYDHLSTLDSCADFLLARTRR